MKYNDYFVTIIGDAGEDSFLVRATNKTEAINKVRDIIIKCSLYPYTSPEQFKFICKKIKL